MFVEKILTNGSVGFILIKLGIERYMRNTLPLSHLVSFHRYHFYVIFNATDKQMLYIKKTASIKGIRDPQRALTKECVVVGRTIFTPTCSSFLLERLCPPI